MMDVFPFCVRGEGRCARNLAGIAWRKKNPCNQLLDSVCCKDFGEVPGGLEPP